MIDMKLELRGLDRFIQASNTFERRLPSAILNGIRRPLRRRITKIKQRIKRECGIGKSIWGSKGQGLDKLVTMIRARVVKGHIQTGVRLKGLPAMIDQGGQIAPHTIRRGFGRSKPMPHPGSAVRAHGIARQEMDNAAGEITREVIADVQKLIDKTFPKGQAA